MDIVTVLIVVKSWLLIRLILFVYILKKSRIEDFFLIYFLFFSFTQILSGVIIVFEYLVIYPFFLFFVLI